jgi:hypothetical protein
MSASRRTASRAPRSSGRIDTLNTRVDVCGGALSLGNPGFAFLRGRIHATTATESAWTRSLSPQPSTCAIRPRTSPVSGLYPCSRSLTYASEQSASLASRSCESPAASRRSRIPPRPPLALSLMPGSEYEFAFPHIQP